MGLWIVSRVMPAGGGWGCSVIVMTAHRARRLRATAGLRSQLARHRLAWPALPPPSSPRPIVSITWSVQWNLSVWHYRDHLAASTYATVSWNVKFVSSHVSVYMVKLQITGFTILSIHCACNRLYYYIPRFLLQVNSYASEVGDRGNFMVPWYLSRIPN